MLRNLVTFLVLYPFSRIAGFVGTVGRFLPVHRFYTWLYDKLVGVEKARRLRDDHIERVAEIVADRDEDIEKTTEELVDEIEERRSRVESLFSDGESVLSLGIAIAAFTTPPVVALALAVVLIISVSVRLTTIQTLAYDEADRNENIERLFAMWVWNGNILSSKNVTGSLISLQLMKRVSDEVYDRWLDEVFAPAVRDFSKREALKRVWVICKEEMWEVETDGESENQVNEKPVDKKGEEGVEI